MLECVSKTAHRSFFGAPNYGWSLERRSPSGRSDAQRGLPCGASTRYSLFVCVVFALVYDTVFPCNTVTNTHCCVAPCNIGQCRFQSCIFFWSVPMRGSFSICAVSSLAGLPQTHSMITAIELLSKDRMVTFCQAVQKMCPVGSYIRPEPGAWEMQMQPSLCLWPVGY